MTESELLEAIRDPAKLKDACDVIVADTVYGSSEMRVFEGTFADLYVIADPDLRLKFRQLRDQETDGSLIDVLRPQQYDTTATES
jgi:hypothetical protein